MRLLSFLILMFIPFIGNSQDSLRLHITDARDLYEYANKGYYLEKVDSVNNFLIITLNKELEEVYVQKQRLELIIEKDNVLIKELFEAFRNCQYSKDKKEQEVKRLEVDNKRLRAEKREAMITGILLVILAVLVKI
jgi:hypothetical protein